MGSLFVRIFSTIYEENIGSVIFAILDFNILAIIRVIHDAVFTFLFTSDADLFFIQPDCIHANFP